MHAKTKKKPSAKSKKAKAPAPTLTLLSGDDAQDVDMLDSLYEKLTGRRMTSDELAEAKAILDE